MNIDKILNSQKNDDGELWKGILAGLAGGLAGAAAMAFYEEFVLEDHDNPANSPAVKATNAVLELTGKEQLSIEAAQDIEKVGKFPMGAILGSAYGGLVENFPMAKQNNGIGLSALLYAGINKDLSENMSIMKAVQTNPKKKENQEMISLLVFGVATEIVRRSVRGLLG